MNLLSDPDWWQVFIKVNPFELDGLRGVSKTARTLVDDHPIWTTWISNHFSHQRGNRRIYQELFKARFELLVGREGVATDLGSAPTMAPRLDPWMKFPPPHFFCRWLLTVTRSEHVEGHQGNGSVLTAKRIADQDLNPLVVDIALDCCMGIRGVEIDDIPFAIVWGGNHVVCLNLDDQTLIETTFDWAADDPIVGAVFADGMLVMTTLSGLICTVDPRQADRARQHHRLGPHALDLVRIGDNLVQLCSPATLWVISQKDEPRCLRLKALQDDAERFAGRDGFMDGEILGARDVDGHLLVELPHTYYMIDLAKGKIVSQHPKGDVRVARFNMMKMTFPYQPRSHLQQSTLSLLGAPVLAMIREKDLVVWLPSQEVPWKVHLDSPCAAEHLWHALTRTGETFECIQLCRDCGRVRLLSFDVNSPEVDREKHPFVESSQIFDLGTGHLSALPPVLELLP